MADKAKAKVAKMPSNIMEKRCAAMDDETMRSMVSKS
jgi:hypothetical protein